MLMIAAFAMAMMRQAGLIDRANALVRHVIFILLSPFADGKIFWMALSFQALHRLLALLYCLITKA
jgi:hypothetical protein